MICKQMKFVVAQAENSEDGSTKRVMLTQVVEEGDAEHPEPGSLLLVMKSGYIADQFTLHKSCRLEITI